jgi:hypothetical protein
VTSTALPRIGKARSIITTPICVASSSKPRVATTKIEIIEFFQTNATRGSYAAELETVSQGIKRAVFPKNYADLSYGRRRPFYNHCQHLF